MNTKGLTDFFEQNWKPLAGIALVVLVVLGGASIWNERRKAREQAAADLLFELQKSAQALAQEKKPAEAEKALQPLLDRYPSSRAAYEATLQSGDWWMESKSYKEAVDRYQKAVSLASDPFSRLLARYDLAIAQEAAGNYQEAVTSYGDALAVEGSDFLQPEIMLAQGRCYEALKQAAKAIDIYKQIEAKFGSRGPYYAGVAAAFASRLSSAGESQ